MNGCIIYLSIRQQIIYITQKQKKLISIIYIVTAPKLPPPPSSRNVGYD